MKNRIFIPVALLAVGLAVSAQAAPTVTFTVTNRGTPSETSIDPSYPGTITATGFTQFVVTASVPSGVIAGIDFTGSAPGSAQISFGSTDALLQDWGASGQQTPTGGALSGRGYNALDSFFVAPSSTTTVLPGATEDNNLAGTGLGAAPISNNASLLYDFGLGTHMSAAWSYSTAAEAATVPVAQLDILNSALAGSTTIGVAEVSWEDVAGDTNSLTAIQVPLTLSVPEPASLSLLGLGAVGLIARRRRVA